MAGIDWQEWLDWWKRRSREERREKTLRRQEGRFHSRIAPDPATGCWTWTGGRCRGGRYGWHASQVAHRVAYEKAKGPIPDGLEIDHLCGNGLCVNPDHLEAVTPEENKRRAWRARRASMES